MIPFDGQLAEKYMLPFAHAAYVCTNPPANFVLNQTAFEIVADLTSSGYKTQLAKSTAKHQQMVQSMLKQHNQPALASPQSATQDQLTALAANPNPNLHFGWVCVDGNKLVVMFRGTEFIHDWLDDFDFVPSPYDPIPGCGTVHQGFQLVYYSIRDSLRTTIAALASKCNQLIITGHSLGGALCALAAPDLLNDVASKLSPVVYTWAEPRVGHQDYVGFYNSHVNVCYRIVNVWDVVPHLPPVIAWFEHEGNSVTIDSGFSLDVVRNHVLSTGYDPGMSSWNQNHPVQQTRHFGRMALSALVGHTS